MFLRGQHPTAVSPPTPELEALRSLTRLPEQELRELPEQGVNRGMVRILCDQDAIRCLDSRTATPAVRALVS